MSEGKKNEDREIWRETPDDYYSPSIHVTKDGGIGFNVGGRVIILRAREWHRLACPPKEIVLTPVEEAELRAAIASGKCGELIVIPNPSPWCPIKTAPKDKTDPISIVVLHDDGIVCSGYFEWASYKNDWRFQTDITDYEHGYDGKPLYWMPKHLPPEPPGEPHAS